jgi:hypothetical protein
MQKEHFSQSAQHACLLLPAPQFRSVKKQHFVSLVLSVKGDSIWRIRYRKASSGLQDALDHQAQIQSQLEHCEVADQYLATCVQLDDAERPLQTAAQAKILFTSPETPVLCTISFADISLASTTQPV